MKKIHLTLLLAAVTVFAACDNNKPGSHVGNITKGYPKASLKTQADTLSYLIGMANSISIEELKQYLASPRVGSDSAYIADFMRGVRDGMEAADNKKKSAYMAGIQVGMQMGASVKSMGDYVYSGDSTKTLSTKNFLAGFGHGVGGKKTAIKTDSGLVDKAKAGEMANQLIQKMVKENMEKQYAEQKKAAQSFIAAKAKEEGVKSLPGGTLYKVIMAGDGAVAHEGQNVKVIYEGRFTDGTVFDASSKHGEQADTPAIMHIGRSIPGFDAALKAMPAGSEWEIYLPYDQAYGEQGNGMIPPFSALIFKVKVIGIAE